jgi:hypothetical protein
MAALIQQPTYAMRQRFWLGIGTVLSLIATLTTMLAGQAATAVVP